MFVPSLLEGVNAEEKEIWQCRVQSSDVVDTALHERPRRTKPPSSNRDDLWPLIDLPFTAEVMKRSGGENLSSQNLMFLNAFLNASHQRCQQKVLSGINKLVMKRSYRNQALAHYKRSSNPSTWDNVGGDWSTYVPSGTSQTMLNWSKIMYSIINWNQECVHVNSGNQTWVDQAVQAKLLSLKVLFLFTTAIIM